MGKDLKGREIGEGVRQRPDGKYIARFRSKSGKRPEKVFEKLSDAKIWLIEQRYKEDILKIINTNITFNEWYKYWHNIIKQGNVKQSTLDRYDLDYRLHIKDYLGEIPIKDIKPLHCQNVLLQMAQSNMSDATIKNARTLLAMIFKGAVENDLIIKNPIISSVKQKGREVKEKYVPTLFVQKRLVSALKSDLYYNCYALALQTGMRSGELITLKWSDINFEERYIDVKRTIYKGQETPPKTKSSYRKIPLTDEAIRILKDQKKHRNKIKQIQIPFQDNVFTTRTGHYLSLSRLDTHLNNVCKELEIPSMSMHNLRHTFATRCIEAGMKPNVLQKILGHTNIKTTMDLYVHVNEDEITKEIRKLANYA